MSQFQTTPFTRVAPPIWARGRTGGSGTITASFLIPAVDADVSIYVDDTTWMQQGQYLLAGSESGETFVGGLFRVKDVHADRILATLIAYDQNSATGTTVPASSPIKIGGRPDQSDLAEGFAAEAEAHKIAAAASAVTAGNAATSAEGSSIAAAASEAAAAASEAGVAADAAAAEAAKLAAEAAEIAAELAQTGAETAETNADASANAAAASAASIVGDVAAAEAARDAAETYRDEAGASATAAQGFAATATTQATSATDSATVASTQASIATTKANEAAASAASIVGDVTDAETARTGAEAAQAAASASASAASGSASAASSSASSAAASAATALTVASGLNYKGFIDGASVAGLSPLAGDAYVVTPAGGGYADLDLIIRNPSGWDVKARSVWLDPFAPSFAARAPRQGIVSTGAMAAATLPAINWTALGLSDWAIGAWVKTVNGSAVDVIEAFSSWRGTQLTVTTTRKLQMRLGNSVNAQAYPASPNSMPADNGWHFCVWQRDVDGNASFWCDGVSLGTTDVSTYAAWTSTPPSSEQVEYLQDSGVLGELFVFQGLLTDDQVAAIHTAGTAQDSGLTFAQHLVPSDSLAVGIFEDVSGNNNHAALGASGISTVLPIDLPSAPVAQALVGDGSAGSSVHATAQAPGTGDFLLEWQGLYPTASSASFATLASLTTTTASDVLQPRSLALGHLAVTGLRLIYLGSSTSHQVRLDSIALHNMAQALSLQGIPCYFAVRRDAGVVSIWFGIPGTGLIFDVTNLCVTTSLGTTPAWSETVDGTRLFGFKRDASNSSAHTLHHLRLLNTAPTLADFEYRVRNGRWHPKFANGSQTVQLVNLSRNADFDAGATDWAGSAGGSVVLNSGYLSITAPAGASGATLPVAQFTRPANGILVEISGTVENLSTGGVGFAFGGSDQFVNEGPSGGANYPLGNGPFVLREVVSNSSSILSLRCLADRAATWDLRDLRFRFVGVTSALDLSKFSDRVIGNSRLSNGSGNFIVSATGITMPEAPVQKVLPFTSLSANGELIDTAGTIPTGDILVDVVVRNTSAHDITGFAFGTASGGDQVTYRTDIPAGRRIVLPVKLSDLNGASVANGKSRLYYSATTWNSGTIDGEIVYRAPSY